MASNADIISALECLVCKEYMTGQIFLCITGHSFCRDCAKKLYICPTCSRPVGSTRNYCLESMAELIFKLKATGQNSSAGSKMLLELQNMPDNHRMCPLENCDWSGQKSMFLIHVKEKHFYVENKWETCWNGNLPTDKMVLIKKGAEIFSFNHKIKDETIYWALQFIGHPEEAGNYRYDIVIRRNDNIKLSISQTCCNSQELDEIIEKKLCPHLPLSFFEHDDIVCFDITVTDERQENAVSSSADAHLPCAECHRIYKCQFESCNWQGRRCALSQHVQGEHRLSYVAGLDSCTSSPSWNNGSDVELSDKIILVEMYGALFYAYQKIKEETVYWVVCYIGEPKKAASYFYTIERLDCTQFKCCHDLQDVDEIIRVKACASLPMSTVRKLRTDKESIRLVITSVSAADERRKQPLFIEI